MGNKAARFIKAGFLPTGKAAHERSAELRANRIERHTVEVTYVTIFDAHRIGALGHNYYAVAQAGVSVKDTMTNPDTHVTLGKNDKSIGRLKDFTVTVPGTRGHGSTAAVVAFGDLGIGARKTSATVVVTCGTFTKAYTVDKLDNMTAKFLYRAIAEIDARHERLNTTATVQPSAAEALRDLTALHTDGILTDEEFAVKRAALLENL